MCDPSFSFISCQILLGWISLSCLSFSLQIYSLTRFDAKCHVCLDLTSAINFSLFASELIGQLSLRQWNLGYELFCATVDGHAFLKNILLSNEALIVD